MNAIIRLILRGVASGEVALTPQVLDALKNLNHDWSEAQHPVSGNRPLRCIKAKKSSERRFPICRITKL